MSAGGWRRPRRCERNLIVIGAGSAGLVTAYIAAALKARVTLVEAGRMGGDCLNTGCVPSKALLRTARLLRQIRHGARYGLPDAVVPPVDFGAVMARVQASIEAIAPHDSVERYRGLGVDVVQGRARLTSPWSVAIERDDGTTDELTARAIVIATGAAPVIPPLPGIDSVDHLTSETLWTLRELPPRLVVLGGGPIGCELAQAFAVLGSRVSVVQRGPRLLPREDDDAAEQVAIALVADGVSLHAGCEPLRCERVDGEQRLIVRDAAGGEEALPFDRLLLATGRRPRTEGLGLEALGIGLGRSGAIETDAKLRTRHPSILACGDVVGPYQFTHAASHQAWHAAVNGLFGGLRSFAVDYRVLPWVTYTAPEIARVGLNEQEAEAQGVAVEVTRYPLHELDRAITESETDGFVKVLTAPGKDRILGVTLVGAHAGEQLAEFTLAMKHGLGLNRILGTIHPYPTWSEAARATAGAWKRAHAPQWALRLLERFHAWRL